VKLADFGIAKRFDDLAASLTVVGSVIGTPQYLAPEQAAGRSVTPQSDVYSTGLVLYEMLVGTRPLPASSSARVGADVRESQPDVSPRVADAVSRSLAPRPEDRFATAADMASTLSGDLVANTVPFGEPTQRSPQTSAENAPTRVIPPDDRTAVWVAAAASTPPAELQPAPPPTRVGRRWWVVAAAIVVLIAVVGFALRKPSNGAMISESTSTVQQTAPPTSSSPVEVIPALLIPGFPATDDISQFIDQLREGGDVVGKQSKRLADALQKLLEMEPEQRAKDAEKLVVQLDEWVDKGEIDPVVAGAAYEFLIDLGAQPSE